MAKVSPKLQKLIDEGVFERLPPTFATYSLDRVHDWDNLFPAERDYFERLFGLLARSEADAIERVFGPLRAVEAEMGVDESTWNRKEFTLAHVDFLQRNPHLAEWRQAINDIFAEINPLLDDEVARRGRPRLVYVVTPADLPMGPDRLWTRLKRSGKLISVDLEPLGEDTLTDYLPLLFTGAPREKRAPTIFDLFGEARDDPYGAWLIESGDELQRLAGSLEGWTGLSYTRLSELREVLMNEVNQMVTREQIPGPRQLGERLRKIDPAALGKAAGRDAVLRNFLRSVLLNGNGTLLINNTFVEWASVQAIRRARPDLLCSAFGIRNKVKPFSSLLIYADQEETNPIPTQADVLGTYVDLEIFYQYLHVECEKWPEYRRNTAYLFIAEGADTLLTIAPPDFPLMMSEGPERLETVFKEARSWLAV